VVVCLVAFTPEGFLSIPTSFSLRWVQRGALDDELVGAFSARRFDGEATSTGSGYTDIDWSHKRPRRHACSNDLTATPGER
jgi:hypothetical protein